MPGILACSLGCCKESEGRGREVKTRVCLGNGVGQQEGKGREVKTRGYVWEMGWGSKRGKGRK